MNINSFRVRFPEFLKTSDAQVQDALDSAALELSAAQWGLKYDNGHGYLAAHKLAMSPWGQNARLMAADGTTTYQRHFDRLVRIVASGGRVV